MKCVDGYYYKTNAYDGEKFCNVTTIQTAAPSMAISCSNHVPARIHSLPKELQLVHSPRHRSDTLATLLQRNCEVQ